MKRTAFFLCLFAARICGAAGGLDKALEKAQVIQVAFASNAAVAIRLRLFVEKGKHYIWITCDNPPRTPLPVSIFAGRQFFVTGDGGKLEKLYICPDSQTLTLQGHEDRFNCELARGRNPRKNVDLPSVIRFFGPAELEAFGHRYIKATEQRKIVGYFDRISAGKWFLSAAAYRFDQKAALWCGAVIAEGSELPPYSAFLVMPWMKPQFLNDMEEFDKPYTVEAEKSARASGGESISWEDLATLHAKFSRQEKSPRASSASLVPRKFAEVLAVDVMLSELPSGSKERFPKLDILLDTCGDFAGWLGDRRVKQEIPESVCQRMLKILTEIGARHASDLRAKFKELPLPANADEARWAARRWLVATKWLKVEGLNDVWLPRKLERSMVNLVRELGRASGEKPHRRSRRVTRDAFFEADKDNLLILRDFDIMSHAVGNEEEARETWKRFFDGLGWRRYFILDQCLNHTDEKTRHLMADTMPHESEFLRGFPSAMQLWLYAPSAVGEALKALKAGKDTREDLVVLSHAKALDRGFVRKLETMELQEAMLLGGAILFLDLQLDKEMCVQAVRLAYRQKEHSFGRQAWVEVLNKQDGLSGRLPVVETRMALTMCSSYLKRSKAPHSVALRLLHKLFHRGLDPESLSIVKEMNAAEMPLHTRLVFAQIIAGKLGLAFPEAEDSEALKSWVDKTLATIPPRENEPKK